MSAKVICVLAGVIGLAAKRMVQQDAQPDMVINKEWYEKENEKANIKIPANAIAIADGAFKDAENLRTIDLTLATNLKSIGQGAFMESGLEKITAIPASVTSIGQKAFQEAKNLKTIDLSQATQLRIINRKTFFESGLESIMIPARVTSIGSKAFKGAKNLTTIDLTKATQLTCIGNQAFDMAENLTTIDLSQTKLKKIPKAAFRYCSKLERVTLPTSLTRIDWVAFWRTRSLKEIDFKRAKDLSTILDGAFGCSGLEKVTIPASVTKIGEEVPPFFSFSSVQELGEKALKDACGEKQELYGGSMEFTGEDTSSRFMVDEVYGREEWAAEKCEGDKNGDLTWTF